MFDGVDEVFIKGVKIGQQTIRVRSIIYIYHESLQCRRLRSVCRCWEVNKSRSSKQF